jgi:hypothetical protein
MRAKLRTWVGSWQVRVFVVCLAYIGIMLWLAPAIAAVSPWVALIALGLLLLAMLVLTWFPLKYIVVPCFLFLQGEKKGGRTDKAKEKFALKCPRFWHSAKTGYVVSDAPLYEIGT